MDCVFCAIIAGKMASSRVYEDNQVLAIMDIRPINPGHILVIPKQHYAQINQIPEETALQLSKVVFLIEKAIWTLPNIRCEGTNILQNNGRCAWQEVFHAHFHVIPRFEGDQFKIRYEPQKPDRATLDEFAAALRLGISEA